MAFKRCADDGVRSPADNVPNREDSFICKAVLDGIYIVRTRLAKEQMGSNETVRSDKQLSQVERAFRSFITIDLLVRPIHHRLEDRVRSHIFLCMPAYYVQGHMMEAWRPLIYADEQQQQTAFNLLQSISV